MTHKTRDKCQDRQLYTDLLMWIVDEKNCPCLSGWVIMNDSTRSIRVLFNPLAKSVVTAAMMLNEWAINIPHECWKY